MFPDLGWNKFQNVSGWSSIFGKQVRLGTKKWSYWTFKNCRSRIFCTIDPFSAALPGVNYDIGDLSIIVFCRCTCMQGSSERVRQNERTRSLFCRTRSGRSFGMDQHSRERVQNVFVSMYWSMRNTTVPIQVADELHLGVLHAMTYRSRRDNR